MGVSSPKMDEKSEWHSEAAVTFTRRSRGPGVGIGTSLILTPDKLPGYSINGHSQFNKPDEVQ